MVPEQKQTCKNRSSIQHHVRCLAELVMLRHGKTRSQPGINNASRDVKVGSISCLKILKTNPISASVGTCQVIYIYYLRIFHGNWNCVSYDDFTCGEVFSPSTMVVTREFFRKIE